jgi:hypothetical protein
MRFELRFYEDEHGRSPVLRWLREALTPTQRRAIGVAMAEILQAEGVGVCRTGYGKQLGDGLFESDSGTTPPTSCAASASPHDRRPPANASCCASSATLTATASSFCSAATTRAPTRAPSASSARSRPPASALPTTVAVSESLQPYGTYAILAERLP